MLNTALNGTDGSSEFSGNTWEQWDEAFPRSAKYLPVLLVRLLLAHKQCLRNEFA